MTTEEAIILARADAVLDLPKRLPLVAEFVAKWLASGHTCHVCYAWKLLELAEWLKLNKPKHVVELGSGLTTAVFCNYFGNEYSEYGDLTPGSRFISVEEDLNQITYMRANLPNPCVEFLHAERIDFDLDGADACRYNLELPIADLGAIDLLYVDGPNCNNGKPGGRLGVDTVAFAEQIDNPRTILFDMRFSAARHFYQTCRWNKRYHFWPSTAIAGEIMGTPWYLSGMRHHEIFQDSTA
mgnify:CR=1 FL=1